MAVAVTSLPPIHLYVHWPYCQHKCPYCDFNSRVIPVIPQQRMRMALINELETSAADFPHGRLASIFFGGGTPTLMAPETVAAVIETARRVWPAEDALEITVEANPNSVDRDRFQALADVGVNRLSLGVQAVDPAALRFLGRQHTVAEAREALSLAARLFPRVSADLIYARPGQDPLSWLGEIDVVMDHGVGHVSVYQLTIEPGTAFHASHVRPLEDAPASDLFWLTRAYLAEQGFPAYEVSNHARPGEACRHNLGIWRGQSYVGIGPGAHGRVLGPEGTVLATERLAHPERWMTAVEWRGEGLESLTPLTAAERRVERILMGLRLNEGLDADVAADLDPGEVNRLAAAGLVTRTASGRLLATENGIRLLDTLLVRLCD